MKGKPVVVLWMYESKKGKKYFSGKVNGDLADGTELVAFKNDNKRDGKKDPDLLGYVSEKRAAQVEDDPLGNL